MARVPKVQWPGWPSAQIHDGARIGQRNQVLLAVPNHDLRELVCELRDERRGDVRHHVITAAGNAGPCGALRHTRHSVVKLAQHLHILAAERGRDGVQPALRRWVVLVNVGARCEIAVLAQARELLGAAQRPRCRWAERVRSRVRAAGHVDPAGTVIDVGINVVVEGGLVGTAADHLHARAIVNGGQRVVVDRIGVVAAHQRLDAAAVVDSGRRVVVDGKRVHAALVASTARSAAVHAVLVAVPVRVRARGLREGQQRAAASDGQVSNVFVEVFAAALHRVIPPAQQPAQCQLDIRDRRGLAGRQHIRRLGLCVGLRRREELGRAGEAGSELLADLLGVEIADRPGLVAHVPGQHSLPAAERQPAHRLWHVGEQRVHRFERQIEAVHVYLRRARVPEPVRVLRHDGREDDGRRWEETRARERHAQPTFRLQIRSHFDRARLEHALRRGATSGEFR